MTAAWLFGGLVLSVMVLMIAELIWPIHLRPKEAPGRLVTNFSLGLINMALLFVVPLSTVAAARWAELSGFGALNHVEMAAGVAFVITLLVRSLSAYALHRLSHWSPLLWRLHRVHHADTAVDLSTGFRHHPGELLLALATYSSIAALLGLSTAALAFYEALAVALNLWSHANFRVTPSLDRLLRLLLVTPAMHHVHHSALQRETDSNFGELSNVWDRVFRTYVRQDLEDARAMRLGLGDAHDEAAANLFRQLASPLA